MTSSIPPIFFGVYQIKPGKETFNSVLEALSVGYRAIDTAEFYRNEKDVGKAILASNIPREEIFVTTKIWCSGSLGEKNNDAGFASALQQIKECNERLNIGYIDLLLLHSPHGGAKGRKGKWLACEKAVELGYCKHIGVSNFGEQHLEELKKFAKIKPFVNQVEVHTYLTRVNLVNYCQKENIIVEAYSPLAKGYGITNEIITSLASKYKKTGAQIMLRFLVQRGLVILPKTTNKNRMIENMNVFDFTISEEDMESLFELNENKTTGWDPTTID